MRIAAAAIVLLAAVAAEGVTIAPGDIAYGQPACQGPCVNPSPPPITTLLDNSGAVKPPTLYGYIAAFGPNGHLFISNGGTIQELDTSLAPVRLFQRPGESTVALTIAQNGNVLALSPDGVLTVYSPTAAVLQTNTLPFVVGSLIPPPSLDLGPDQCTLFYTDGALSGRRYDICNDQPLASLAPGQWNAVRAMSDGGYIAVAGSTFSIFEGQNHRLREFTPNVDAIVALAFDSDPRFLIAGTLTAVNRIRLADGVRTAFFGGRMLYLAVNAEQRPAAAPFATDIPALSPPLLFAVALGLTALAWQRLRA